MFTIADAHVYWVYFITQPCVTQSLDSHYLLTQVEMYLTSLQQFYLQKGTGWADLYLEVLVSFGCCDSGDVVRTQSHR